ncbi:unnamed protein product [Cochlearia groenlandica]
MEEKKAEEPKVKSEDKKEDDKEKKKEPQEIVLKIFMHCEGCAKKIHRYLKGFEGVEDVTTDCKSSKVVVKGDKADPLKVLHRLQKKSHRQVELLSPIPEPKPVSDEQEKKKEEEEKPKPQEKKEEVVVTVVLKVHMHCEACAMEIQKRIMRMKGVESVEPDFKASQVSVKGVFAPEKLVEFVYKKIGKHAAVVKQDPPPKPAEKDKEAKDKEEKKKEEEQKPKEEKDGGGGGGEAKPAAAGEEEGNKVVDMKKNEYQYQPPRYPVEMFAYPPQIFSDDNPNACTIM